VSGDGRPEGANDFWVLTDKDLAICIEALQRDIEQGGYAGVGEQNSLFGMLGCNPFNQSPLQVAMRDLRCLRVEQCRRLYTPAPAPQ
jgi:hypothetical protein